MQTKQSLYRGRQSGVNHSHSWIFNGAGSTRDRIGRDIRCSFERDRIRLLSEISLMLYSGRLSCMVSGNADVYVCFPILGSTSMDSVEMDVFR